MEFKTIRKEGIETKEEEKRREKGKDVDL